MPSSPDRLRTDRLTAWRPRRVTAAALVAGAVTAVQLAAVAAGQQAPAPAKTSPPPAAATPTPGGEGGGIQAPPLGRLIATPPAAVEDPLDALESMTPPDGKWLTAEDGREYFLTRLKKIPGTYTKLPDGKTVAYQKIYRWQYDREDAEYFYVRVYKAADVDPTADIEAARKAVEDKARIEASYKVELAFVDRLQFTAFDSGLPREGQWRQGFDVADMNGDGHLDIVHNSPRKQIFTPVVFLGDGKGGWRYWSEVTWPNIAYDYGDAAAGDFDRDGRMDMALGIHLRGIKVLLQKSPGVFTDASEGLHFEIPGQGGDASTFASRTLEVIDWNADGKQDVIALGEGARQSSTVGNTARGLPTSSAFGVVIYLNVDGSSWQASSVGSKRGVFGDSIAFGKFDEDDRIDLVTSSSSMGNRNVLFFNDSQPEGYRQADLGSLPQRALTYAVATGDFDEDGKDDIVTSFGTHEGDLPRSGLALHRRDGEGVWHSRLLFVDQSVDGVWALAAGDLDADGHLDLVAPSQRGKVTVLLGDGKGGVSLEQSAELDAQQACRGYHVRLVDLDGDGRSEVVASFAGEAGDMAKLLDMPVCAGEGALKVWKAAPKPGKANS